MAYWSDRLEGIETRARAGAAVHLCCGRSVFPGATGVDRIPGPGVDTVWDLDVMPYPFADGQFRTVICLSALEHLRDIPAVMGEIWRISARGAKTFILSPHFSDAASFVDPTHLHHFSARSFDYFIEGTPLFQAHGYYSRARFRLLYRRLMLQPYCSIFEGLANRHVGFYENVLCYVLRAKGIYLELETAK